MVLKRGEKPGRPLVLGLGGTGVIGQALAAVLERRGLDYVSISLSPDILGADGPRNLCFDLHSATVDATAKILERFQERHIVGVIDILGGAGPAAEAVAAFAARRNIPVATISSCLLYKHEGTGVVDEECPSLSLNAASQPYIRAKLLLEAFWRKQPCEWVLVRTHHVLGRGSLLGCIPAHNRDPQLLERIRTGTSLALAHRGMIKVSYVHPEDLADVILEVLLKRIEMNRVVNIVYPEPVLARDYYASLATELGSTFPEPTNFDTDPTDFWIATARDNIYASIHPVVKAYGFAYGINSCIRSALSIEPQDYAQLGDFMRRRIVGQPEDLTAAD